MIAFIFLIVFLVSWCIQIAFYVVFFRKLAFFKTKKTLLTKYNLGISVIICARNEFENLSNNIDKIATQAYKNFEIIVVNDASTDDTSMLLEMYAKKYHHFRFINISEAQKTQKGKKQALAQGIVAAKNEILVLTDADCWPASKQWLSLMARHFDNEQTDVVLAYGPYETTNSFLNKCIQFETLYTALQYLSFALIGSPYMGVGRNLAYRKKKFEQTNGFSKNKHIISGDDDLFINQIADKHNTVIEINTKSFCYSSAANSWKTWYQQKSRHLSTGKYYTFKHKFLLAMLSVSHFLFYGMLIAVSLSDSDYSIVVFAYLARFVIQVYLWRLILQKLQPSFFLLWIPILDLLFVLYYFIFIPSIFLTKPTEWNHRN
ncbi:MAG: glycosyltransferase [Chitinophagales bacterium]